MNANWAQLLAGRFVVLDGPDGCGKTTQFKKLKEWVEAQGQPVCALREPGGTEYGELIRNLLLDPNVSENLNLRCEMLLFMASRAQLVAQRIKPALDAKQFVLVDRFISSTLAYQGTAGGLDATDIRRVGQAATGGLLPDLTILFDVDTPTAMERMNPLNKRDRVEQKEEAYHAKVREGYLQQASDAPSRHVVINAGDGPDEVFGTLVNNLHQFAHASGWDWQ